MQRQQLQRRLLAATFAGLVCWATVHAQVMAQQPNIVTVFIDDLGWGDFSCFGNKRAKTPAIDRLAAEGIRFTQFYVNSPICSPSRVALTTGHYPQRWKVGSYLAHRNENEKRGIAQWLDPAAPTLARFLKQAGYRTGHFGKWHMGGQRDVADAPPITDYGFDESLTNFEGMGPKLLPLTTTPDGKQGRIWQDAERLTGPATWMQRSRITGGFTEAASSFIREAAEAGTPFYVNLWPDDVHAPYWPPVDQWRDDREGKFRAVLEAMDGQLAPLFELLRSTPALRDNTLLLVCSDNGPEPGVGSAGVFRGAKTTLYEGGIRSPLIVWGPGLVSPEAAGSSDQASVFAAFDLVPSLLAVAGVVVPKGIALDGFDVSPALLGRRPAGHPDSICWRRPPDRKLWRPLGKTVLPDLALRRGNYKVLCDYDGGNRQLFDLANDPGETQNLAEIDPERAATLAAEVVAWHEQLPADNGPALGRQAMQAAGVGPGNVLGRQLIAADSSRRAPALSGRLDPDH
jgi:arylsulfatase A-like enzyme